MNDIKDLKPGDSVSLPESGSIKCDGAAHPFMGQHCIFEKICNYGIIPIKHIENNTYECCVDHCETILIGCF
jgi:hypothetical protein